MSVILFVVLCIVSLLKRKITYLILLFKNEETASPRSLHTRGHSTALTVGSPSLRPTAESVLAHGFHQALAKPAPWLILGRKPGCLHPTTVTTQRPAWNTRSHPKSLLSGVLIAALVA